MQFTDILNGASRGLVQAVSPAFLQNNGFGDLFSNLGQGTFAQNQGNSWNQPTVMGGSMSQGMGMVDPFQQFSWGRSNPLASMFSVKPGSSMATGTMPDIRAGQPAPTPGSSPATTPAAAPGATPPPAPAPGPVTPTVTPTPSNNVLSYATQALGKPYVWGAEDPNSGFDCSGLVQWAYKQAGISLPRTAQQQFDATTRVAMKDLQVGDLVFFTGTDPSDPDTISHVGIYAGNGRMINAPTQGQAVQYMDLANTYWASHFAGGGRVGQ